MFTRRGPVIALAVAASALSLSLPWYFRGPSVTQDEGVQLVHPERLRAGDLPNRDFEHIYGPSNVWILAGLYEVLGPSVAVERAVGLAYRVALAAALFALAFGWSAWAATVAAALSAAMTVSLGIVAVDWFAALATALWGIHVTSRSLLRGAPTGWGMALGGLLGGLALTFRWDAGVAVSLSSLALLSAAPWLGWLRYLAGAAVGLLPWIIQFLLVGPLVTLQGVVFDPVFRMNTGRRLPLPPEQLEAQVLLALLLACTLTLLAAGAVAVARERSLPRPRVLLALAAFCVGILPQALQRADPIHLLYVAAVTLSLTPVAVIDLLAALRGRASSAHRDGVAVAVAALLFLGIAPAVARPLLGAAARGVGLTGGEAFPVEHGDRSIVLPTAEQAKDLSALLAEVDRRAWPGARLFVGPIDLRRTLANDTFLYFLLPELQPASYFLMMNPGTANAADSRMAEEIRGADFVVLTHRFEGRLEPNESQQPGSAEPGRVLADDFRRLGRYGLHELYARRDAPPGRS